MSQQQAAHLQLPAAPPCAGPQPKKAAPKAEAAPKAAAPKAEAAPAAAAAAPKAEAKKEEKKEAAPKAAAAAGGISASLVKELRESTGAGMMDCKKALAECEGDLEKAKEVRWWGGVPGGWLGAHAWLAGLRARAVPGRLLCCALPGWLLCCALPGWLLLKP